jgi:hypothetical protein
MKMIKYLPFAALLLSAQGFAGQYEYDKNTYDISLNKAKTSVTVKHCNAKKKCKESQANIPELIELLELRIKDYDTWLKDEPALLKEVKSQVANKDTQRIKDGKTEYTMLKIGEGFSLPVPSSDLKKGNYDLITGALAANKERYSGALTLLKSAKLPAPFKTDDYAKANRITELVNIIQFAKML